MGELPFMAAVDGTAQSASPAPAVSVEVAQDDCSIAVGDPAVSCELDPKNIWVYMQSMTNIGDTDPNAPVAAFDVVFSIGVADGKGGSCTYQVVKRIGVDKVKLAQQACQGTPVSIVEAKTEEKPAQKTFLEGSRFRRLAGLE